MDSNFKVKCPYCNEEYEFVDDDWMDELIDDSDHTIVECSNCEYLMEIITHATYKLEVLPCITEEEEKKR